MKANLDMLNGSRSERIAGIHEETSISPKAVVKESVVGKGVKIQEGAYIENSSPSFYKVDFKNNGNDETSLGGAIYAYKSDNISWYDNLFF